jgi:hypothetical protein
MDRCGTTKVVPFQKRRSLTAANQCGKLLAENLCADFVLRLVIALGSRNFRIGGDPPEIEQLLSIIHSAVKLFLVFERPGCRIPYGLNGGQFSSQETMQESLQTARHIVPRYIWSNETSGAGVFQSRTQEQQTTLKDFSPHIRQRVFTLKLMRFEVIVGKPDHFRYCS